METAVGVYASNEEAIAAVRELQKTGYPAKQLSVLAKADLVNNHIRVKTHDTAEKAEVSIGVIGGTILGILTGVGIFLIPGLGFLFGAGALVGALAGADFGIIAGGLTAIFTSMGVAEALAIKYEKRLNEGKFLVFAQGDEKQIDDARRVLNMQPMSLELEGG